MVMLPACPALELSSSPPKIAAPLVVAGQGQSGTVYAAPAGFQNPDLSNPGDPPASLGQFWPQPK